jgi:hypothetical protein
MDRVFRYVGENSIRLRGATSFQNLPFASDDTSWDGSKARDRVAKWASSDGSGDKDKISWQRYRKAFFWYDAEDSENLGSYKLPFADVFDGSLKAVWRGVTAAAGSVRGARNKPDIPESDVPAVKNHIGRYYSKHGDTPPWEEESSMTEEMKKNMEEVETADPEASDEATAVEATEKEAEVPATETEVPVESEAPEAVEAEEEKSVEAEEVETEDAEAEEVEAEVETEEVETEPESDIVLEAILALSTQIDEMSVKIVGAIEKALSPVEDEKTEEQESPEEEKALDSDELRKEILAEVRAMVEELKHPVARKSTVDVEEEVDSYKDMSLDELNAALKAKIGQKVPNRI